MFIMRSTRPDARRIIRNVALWCAATLLAAGCVESKPRKTGLTYSDGKPAEGQPDLSTLQTYVPQGLSSSTSIVSPQIALLGTIEYDGNLLPLISPAGEFMAVQGSHPAPSWGAILAAPVGDAPSSLDIVVYRIEKQKEGPGQRLVEYQRLDGIGLIGRSADADGFLVESPQPDGTRRIGYVRWTTGEVTWLLKSGVNAFAARSQTGRMAWCERVEGEQHAEFNLYVQGPNEVYRAGDGGGSYLYPVWCGNEDVLFAFQLQDSGDLDLVVFDTRSAEAMRHPLQSERLTNEGTVLYAYQALAGIPDPPAPDASPRILFYHIGQNRVFEYDAREPAGRRVRGLPAPSMAAAWHTDEGVVYSSASKFYYQFLRDGSEPVELLKGGNVPRQTSNPLQPFILTAVDEKVPFQLNLWVMALLTEDDVRAAAEHLDPNMVNKSKP